MTQPAAGQPWQCPACSVWLAPHVNEHRCDPGGAVPAKVAGGGGGEGPATTFNVLPFTSSTVTATVPVTSYTLSSGTG